MSAPVQGGCLFYERGEVLWMGDVRDVTSTVDGCVVAGGDQVRKMSRGLPVMCQ
ncbi:hypothetical protein K530_55060 [Streptomyces noursei CCRC 11814]|nr:hypothetical protein K530_55060 [Streptomyces noursei CCRC 11814]